jgi:OFA family oxalate/formate antiporter-like MFS transporter
VSTPASSDNPGTEAKELLGYSRWWQVVAAAVMMALVSPYQYVWSAIEGPLASELGTDLSVLGFVFTAYVIIMALIQFPAGWWRDRYGPRAVTLAAGVLAGGGYIALAFAPNIWVVYLSYVLGAAGVGMVYTVAVNTAVKWFPDRRGLATGAGTMAFAAGSTIFVPYVRWFDDQLTFALASMGVLMTIGIFVGTVVLRDPPTEWIQNADAGAPADDQAVETVEQTTDEESAGTRDHAPDGGTVTQAAQRQFTWREMVRTWQFWIMYFMFFAVSAAGLMITARVIRYAEESGLGATAATVAGAALPLAAGGGRLVLGGLSDRFDRERIVSLSFLTCGLATLVLVGLAGIGSGVGYIVAVIVAAFFWNAQFSLFPSLVGDYYGAEHSSTNYSLIYSGKMWGGVFGGGVVGWLVGVIGWDAAFLLGGGLALFAGIAGFVLRSPRQ